MSVAVVAGEAAGDGEARTVGEAVRTRQLRAAALHAALVDALLFVPPASLAARHPGLAVVRLEAGGGQLVAVATDTYTLGARRVDYSGEPFTASVGMADAKRLAQLAKTTRQAESWRVVDVEIGADGRLTFQFSTFEALTVAVVEGEFPQWRKFLRADAGQLGKSVGTGYNPKLVAKFTKVELEKGARMQVYPTMKERGAGPTLVQIGADFAGVIMPMGGGGGRCEFRAPAWVEATGNGVALPKAG